MKIFDDKASVSIKSQKIKEIILLISTFVVVPLFSMLVTLVREERPVSTSMSRIAWVDKDFVLVALWGLFNMANYIYALCLVVKSGGYNDKWKKFFIISAAFAALCMTVGLSIPAYYSETDIKLIQMRTAHVVISGAGLFYYVAECCLLALTLIKRNKRQFMLSVGICLLMIFGVLFALLYVNDPTGYCFCSTVTQLFLFGVCNVFMTIQYYFMTQFKPEKEDSEK